MPRPLNAIRDRIMKKKWASLKKRGIEPPKNAEENKKRAREAHHGS